MNRFLAAILGAALFAGVASAATNLTGQADNDATAASATNSTEQDELDSVMRDDDRALDDVNRWIEENNAYAARGAGESKDELNKRILARLQDVRDEYENYLKKYSTNAPAYLAYGSFLDNIGDEDGACGQYEKSQKVDPQNPAVWNNLGNYYGEHGPTTNAFADYQKAIDLDPTEPVYYENFATIVYLYRRDAEEFFSINETQVFDKSLALYQKAIQLDPKNFTLWTDYAESYYGIRPLRTNDALAAWTNALKVADNEMEREGVYIHLARIKIAAGRYAEAQGHLDAVTNAVDAAMKARLERNLREREKAGTNTEPYFLNWNTNAASAGTNGVTGSSNVLSNQKTP